MPGYVCARCKEEVEVNPVEDKVICPKCSHRVLFKQRSDDPDHVPAE